MKLAAVAWNANKDPRALSVAALAGRPLALHAVQAASVDPLVRTATFDVGGGTFHVPGRAICWRATSTRWSRPAC